MAAPARVTVESIAAGGDGIARRDGMAVFIPRTAPGDVADVRIRPQGGGRFGRGELVRVVEAAAARVTPRCQHYEGDRCGGCQLQHLAYDAQLEAKRRIVRDAIQRIARRDVELPDIVPSPSPWAYRSKLTLTLRYDGGGWTMGLHAFDDPNRVFALRECPITDPVVVSAWREIEQAAGTLPPARELRGAVRRLGDELALVLEGGDRWDQTREFARRCPSLQFIRWSPATSAPRVIVDRRSGQSPAASFEQVNPDVARLLRADLLARARATPPATVVDAYAGTGQTAVELAALGARVTTIEVDAEAATYCAARLPAGSRAVTARVEDVLAGLLPVDLVILNPPRTGVDARVAAALQDARGVHRVLYASCDPATLARDLARMPRYRIAWLWAYDMFPQTAHVEAICELTAEDT